jgi:hypothetical protein
MDQQTILINYRGQPLQVTALSRGERENIAYDCYTAGVKLGTVYPTIGKNVYVDWVGSPDMPEELVKLIGKEIVYQYL